MKKLLAVLISGMLLSLTACGGETSTVSSQNAVMNTTSSVQSTVTGAESVETTRESTTGTNLDFDGSAQSDTGEGTFSLVNQSGSTADGNPIIVYAGSDDVLLQIEFDTDGINGGSLSYIYIDGMEKEKQQVSDSQVTMDLSGDDLSVGTHKVELVQFENDDPAGTVTTYKSAEYEVKAK